MSSATEGNRDDEIMAQVPGKKVVVVIQSQTSQSFIVLERSHRG